MFATLRNAFRVKEIRQKLWFTFLMLLIIRFGCQLPCPGVDRRFFAEWFAQQSGGAFSFLSAFTGGSFEKMSIFALYHPVHYIFHYYPASDHRYPEIGRNAERWRRWQKENSGTYPLRDCRSGSYGKCCNGNRFW